LQPLFAPGILYNTIKSGISVDFPVITTPKKTIVRADGTDIYALRGTSDQVSDGESYAGGVFWDKRLPFETILDPDRHMTNLQFFDMEPHPSASLNATASFNAPANDPSFKKMSNNFFNMLTISSVCKTWTSTSLFNCIYIISITCRTFNFNNMTC